MTAADRLIVALDVTDAASALRMARRLRGVVRTVKIGSALFTACGPDVIRRVRALGFQVMLDLKFHDIPSTVELSCRSAAGLRVSLLTVHAIGGRDMLSAAVRGARREAARLRIVAPKVVAVTVLTSVGASGSRARREVVRLAGDAARAGCDGVVASAREVPALRRRFGTRLMLVCPGIRPSGGARGDQRRVATPADALAAGADRLVVGRPITGADNPRWAAREILDEMKETT
jgi:orotidine-5'-phosphate decarboxylase